MTDDHCAQAPRSCRFRQYRLELDHRWRFGFSDGMRGVAGCRTPLGAWFAWCRWRRQPAKPIP